MKGKELKLLTLLELPCWTDDEFEKRSGNQPSMWHKFHTDQFCSLRILLVLFLDLITTPSFYKLILSNLGQRERSSPICFYSPMFAQFGIGAELEAAVNQVYLSWH